MAYLHQVDFDLTPQDLQEVDFYPLLDRVVNFMRSLLPNFAGFISAQVYTSVELADHVHVMVTSRWDDWSDLVAHRNSWLAEGKILTEFSPVLDSNRLRITSYQEIG